MNKEITSNGYEVAIGSPGRINLIGEHLDYNGGMVLPAAINLRVTLFFRENQSNSCQIRSKDLGDSFTFSLGEIRASSTEWHNYFLGVVYFINELYPEHVSGFDCLLESELPIGSGVSSSAALECGIAKGLSELFDIKLSDDEIIQCALKAEHHFVGTKCGVMDQLAVVKGKSGHLILLNCQNLSFDYIPAEFDTYTIVLLNTNVSHNLASSEYNVRRHECERAVLKIGREYPEYEFLAGVPEEIVARFKDDFEPTVFKRALFVVQENARTIEASKDLKQGDLISFGEKLFQSHKGLSELYDVSCEELDFLVDVAREVQGVLGSRMMGGGFGGCTINLVHKEKVDFFINTARVQYEEKFKVQLTPHIVSIGDGVKRII